MTDKKQQAELKRTQRAIADTARGRRVKAQQAKRDKKAPKK